MVGEGNRAVDVAPAEARGAARPSSAVPTDIRMEARQRLGWVALLLAVTFLGFTALGAALAALGTGDRVSPLDALLGALSLVMFGLTRSAASDRATLRVGLVFLVLVVGLIHLGNIGGEWRAHGHLPAATFASVLLVAVPLLVPAPPLRTLAAAGVAASTAPLSVWLLGAITDTPFDASAYLRVSVVPVASAGLAVLGSFIVHGFQRKVTEARELGAYRLGDMIGRGGMGEVWRAEHALLARPAAIKLIRSGDGAVSELALKRFEREARVTASLRSPHTIALYDFGVARDGAVYYVMELLRGRDMHALVRRHGPLPPARVVHLLRQMCHSLHEAHEAGLVHRDIKPANAFVCVHGQDHDFVKVLDFGLVKPRETEDEPRPDLRLTQQQVVTGTPGFIAPEALGDEKLDGRADLYALGCVAYWLLTGREVFEHATLMAMLMAHAQQQPRPPSETVSGIPPELEAVVMRLLAKEPGGRPQSAQALAVELKALHLAERWVPAKREAWWAQRPARTPPPQTSVPTVAIPN